MTKMKTEYCPKLKTCKKVKIGLFGRLLDKDLLDPVYSNAIREVCSKCEEPPYLPVEIMNMAAEFTSSHNDGFLKQHMRVRLEAIRDYINGVLE